MRWLSLADIPWVADSDPLNVDRLSIGGEQEEEDSQQYQPQQTRSVLNRSAPGSGDSPTRPQASEVTVEALPREKRHYVMNRAAL